MLETRYPLAYFIINHYIIFNFFAYTKTAASESLRIAAVLLSLEHFIFFIISEDQLRPELYQLHFLRI